MAPKPRPPLERLWPKVHIMVDGCWTFSGAGNGIGHGKISLGRGMGWAYAHRLTYEWAYGRIDDGFVIDHLCRNPSCVRPDHLEAVTHQENIRRGRETDVCPRGHPYTDENTQRNPRGKGFTKVCRTCIREVYAPRRKAKVTA